jgi:riboflavin synthase alpha subunit
MFSVYEYNNEEKEDTVMDEKTEKMIEYIRSLKAIEDAMEPYKEQKRELRKDFKEQGWLTGDEISLTVKAYRMMKSEVDIDELVKIYDSLRGGNK